MLKRGAAAGADNDWWPAQNEQQPSRTLRPRRTRVQKPPVLSSEPRGRCAWQTTPGSASSSWPTRIGAVRNGRRGGPLSHAPAAVTVPFPWQALVPALDGRSARGLGSCSTAGVYGASASCWPFATQGPGIAAPGGVQRWRAEDLTRLRRGSRSGTAGADCCGPSAATPRFAGAAELLAPPDARGKRKRCWRTNGHMRRRGPLGARPRIPGDGAVTGGQRVAWLRRRRPERGEETIATLGGVAVCRRGTRPTPTGLAGNTRLSLWARPGKRRLLARGIGIVSLSKGGLTLIM